MIQPPKISPLGLALDGMATVCKDTVPLGFEDESGLADERSASALRAASFVASGILDNDTVIRDGSGLNELDIAAKLAYIPYAVCNRFGQWG